MDNSPETVERGKSLPLGLLYVGFGLVILAVLVWTSMRTLQNTPSRQASTQMADGSWLTLTLTTDPSPPLPTGTVRLRVMAENPSGGMAYLGPALPFQMGAKGSSEVLEDGTLAFSANGEGYQTGLQFPTPGDYWLDFNVGQGKTVRFQVYVKPAQ